jgi:hypothetical protein
MKHLMVLGLTASVVALASCSSDELIQAPSSAGATPIAFNGVAVNKSTRSDANEISKETLKAFSVNGWISSEDNTDASNPVAKNTTVFDNEKVSRESSESDWTHKNLQYWTAGTYYFTALAPEAAYTNENVIADTGDDTSFKGFSEVKPTLTKGTDGGSNSISVQGSFTFNNNSGTSAVSDDITAVPTATLTDKTASNKAVKVEPLNTPLDIDLVYATAKEDGASHTSTESDVSLTFNHLLSRVAFQFTNGFSNSTTKLAIKNIIVYGVAVQGDVDVTNSTWTWAQKDNADDVQNVLFGDVDKIATAAATENTEDTNVGTSENYYLIPYTAGDKSYNVTFDVVQYAPGEGGDDEIATYQKVAALPKITMAAGNSYLYTLLLNPETIGLNEITFKVEVNGWGEYDAEGSTNAVEGYPATETTNGSDGGNQQ